MERLNEAAPSGPVGIGGWLLLPLLHLLIFIGTAVLQVGEQVSVPGALARLVQGAATLAADVLKGDVTAGEWIGMVIFVSAISFLLYPALCLVQFLRKKRSVPKMMIAYYSLILIVSLITFGIGLVAGPQAAAGLGGQDEAIKELLRAVLACAIWIPYFIQSERVANTFVR